MFSIFSGEFPESALQMFLDSCGSFLEIPEMS